MNSFPFDSHVTYDSDGIPEFDRAVDSEGYRSLLKQLFKTGIMPTDSTNLQVTTGEDMTVTVLPGFAIVEGCMALEDTSRTLTVQAASSTYDRIDTVVLRLDNNDSVRTCDLYVVEGTPSASPVHPDLTRESDIYELGLADILVSKSSTSISASKITDTRYNSERCGVLSSISEFDTSTIDEQMEVWESEQRSEFKAWVASLKDILDTETATHLQTEIDAANTEIDDLDTRVEALEADPTSAIIAAEYDESTTYNAYDEVIYDKQLWRCLATCTGVTPVAGTYWKQVTVAGELSQLNSNLNALGIEIKSDLTITVNSSGYGYGAITCKSNQFPIVIGIGNNLGSTLIPTHNLRKASDTSYVVDIGESSASGWTFTVTYILFTLPEA